MTISIKAILRWSSRATHDQDVAAARSAPTTQAAMIQPRQRRDALSEAAAGAVSHAVGYLIDAIISRHDARLTVQVVHTCRLR